MKTQGHNNDSATKKYQHAPPRWAYVGSMLGPCEVRVGTMLDEGADPNQMLIAPAGMVQMSV